MKYPQSSHVLEFAILLASVLPITASQAGNFTATTGFTFVNASNLVPNAQGANANFTDRPARAARRPRRSHGSRDRANRPDSAAGANAAHALLQEGLVLERGRRRRRRRRGGRALREWRLFQVLYSLHGRGRL